MRAAHSKRSDVLLEIRRDGKLLRGMVRLPYGVKKWITLEAISRVLSVVYEPGSLVSLPIVRSSQSGARSEVQD